MRLETEEKANIKCIAILLGLLAWYILNYGGCMADYKMQGFPGDARRVAQVRGFCVAISILLPVPPIFTGGYYALRHNGWTW